MWWEKAQAEKEISREVGKDERGALENEKERERTWKQSERVRQTEDRSERGDSCGVSRWLSSGSQRQTPFSNPIVSAGRHPAPLCNPVNMHPIPSRKHTHTCAHSFLATYRQSSCQTSTGVAATHRAVATHKHNRQEASCRDTLSKSHKHTHRSTHKPPRPDECLFFYFSFSSFFFLSPSH